MRMSAKLKKDVRCHPSPAGVPALEQCQDETEPDPVKWDGPGLRVAHEEEECRSRQASENAPPLVVFYEKIADMANRNRNDCDGFQPIGVVYTLVCSPNAQPRASQRSHVPVEGYLGPSTNGASFLLGRGDGSEVVLTSKQPRS